MNSILVIAGFITLYIVAHQMVSVKRDRPFGFQPPKKTLWQKIKNLFER